MRIGFLSDAHGNPFGLDACLERLHSEGAERIYFLGDAFGYWPHGKTVAEKLFQLGIFCIKGNHDAMVVGLLPIPEEKEDVYRLKSCFSSLPTSTKELIVEEWPVQQELNEAGKKILLVHGRPADQLEGYLYENGLLEPPECDDFNLVVMGHTHYPFVKYEDDMLLLNVGSCGLPRDVGNMASCAIYDTKEHSAKILRVPIDTEMLLASCPPGSVSAQVIECLQRKDGRKEMVSVKISNVRRSKS